MRKFLLACMMILAGVGVAFAQEMTVSGKVTAADDGSALPGVSIAVKGTNKGTQTDVNGVYKLTVTKGAVLQFSFVGYDPQSITITNQSILDVQLASGAETLQEVVVTALGITREKKSLGYATQEVKGGDVNTAKETNFINSLSGKASGIEISRNNNLGASSNVVIRGFKSLTGNNQALFVVDGIPMDNQNSSATINTGAQTGRGGYDYGNTASDINPDDIESINILKGAAATALYGARAANGVVMVTTKKGRKNAGIGLTVGLGYNTGMIDKSTFPKYQTQYGGGYGKYYEDPTGKFLYRDINGDGVDDLVMPTSEDASYGGKFDPALMVYDWTAFDPSSPNYGKARPWVAAANNPIKFFKNSQTFNTNIGLDGGNEFGTYRVSYTRLDQTGIMPNSKLQKNIFNFSGTYDFTKKLTATTNFNYVRQDGKGRYGNGYSDNIMTSFRQWYQTNVDVLELRDAYERTGKNITWNWADPTDLKPIYWDNFYFQRYQNYETDWRNRYFGNVALDYKINSVFSATGRVSLDTYNELQEERVAVGSIANDGTAKYSRFDHSFSEINYDLFVKFNKDITPDFNLSGLVGGNIRNNKDAYTYATTVGGLVVPGLYALGNSASALSAPVESYRPIYQEGIFANVSLGYKDFLFLDATARRDRSSTLPVGNNTYFYPSISGSFIFSNILKQDWLSFGKVRLNYAEVGNTAPALSIYDTYSKPTNLNANNRDAFGGQPMFQVSATKNNPYLKPERTKSSEIGLEMKFLKNRLGFDAAYYRTLSVDQIMPVSVSRATGYSFKYVNAGTIENKGLELSAFVIPVETKDFQWKLGANFTRNRNKVVSLYEGVDNLQIASFQQGVTLNATVGQSYGVLKGTNFVFNDKGEKVVAANGYYSKTGTDAVIGNINPKWRLGITNTLTYRKATLSFLIDIKQGGNVFSLDQAYGMATGLYPETVFNNDLGNPVRNSIATGGGYIVPGVLADGSPNTKRVNAENYGLFGYVRNPNAAFIYNASYIKLREVAISYPIPTSIFGKTSFVKGASLSLTGRNLWIIKKYLPYADPEDGTMSGNVAGFQSGVYPSLREVGANLKLSF